jgi:penicillin-binding protein-related factor A (putative recombinase)
MIKNLVRLASSASVYIHPNGPTYFIHLETKVSAHRQAVDRNVSRAAFRKECDQIDGQFIGTISFLTEINRSKQQ